MDTTTNEIDKTKDIPVTDNNALFEDSALFINDYQFTLKLFNQFQKGFYKHLKPKRYIARIALTIIYAANALLFSILDFMPLAGTFGVLFLFMIYFTIMLPNQVYKRDYEAFTANNGTSLKRVFYESYFTLISKSGSSNCRYENLSDYYETRDLIILADKDKDNIILTKSGFTKGTYDTFISFVDKALVKQQ